MRRRVPLLVALAAFVLCAVPAFASDPPTTTCDFSGPTGTFAVLPLTLAKGSDFLTLQLTGTRTTRPTGTSTSWHLVQGIVVLEARSKRLVAYRIAAIGAGPRRAVVSPPVVASQAVDQPGPDIPLQYSAARFVAKLPAGSYLVVAFGSDGDNTPPNDWWAASLGVAGVHSCNQVGSGAVFDADQTQFLGGNQVTAGGVSYLDGAAYAMRTRRQLVVGVMQATAPIGSNARLTYVTPSSRGSVDTGIAPFVSGTGAYRWSATASGVAPVIDVAGVAIDPV